MRANVTHSLLSRSPTVYFLSQRRFSSIAKMTLISVFAFFVVVSNICLGKREIVGAALNLPPDLSPPPRLKPIVSVGDSLPLHPVNFTFEVFFGGAASASSWADGASPEAAFSIQRSSSFLSSSSSFWSSSSSSILPQRLWFRFAEPKNVVKFSFASSNDDVDDAASRGAKGFRFWASNGCGADGKDANGIDAELAILYEESPGTSFADGEAEKIGIVGNEENFLCYGFEIWSTGSTAPSDNGSTVVSNVKFWTSSPQNCPKDFILGRVFVGTALITVYGEAVATESALQCKSFCSYKATAKGWSYVSDKECVCFVSMTTTKESIGAISGFICDCDAGLARLSNNATVRCPASSTASTPGDASRVSVSSRVKNGAVCQSIPECVGGKNGVVRCDAGHVWDDGANWIEVRLSSCPGKGCRVAPVPSNYSGVIGDWNCDAGFDDASVCVSSCGDGFLGNAVRVCESGVWTPRRQCEKRRCGPKPTAPPNSDGWTCDAVDAVGSICRPRCRLGFGVVGDVSIECQRNGVWSKTVSRCRKIRCRDLSIDAAPDEWICSAENDFGSVCKLVCRDVGPRGGATLICGSRGKWVGSKVGGDVPRCREMKCGAVVVENGETRDCDARVGGECRVECRRGFYSDVSRLICRQTLLRKTRWIVNYNNNNKNHSNVTILGHLPSLLTQPTKLTCLRIPNPPDTPCHLSSSCPLKLPRTSDLRRYLGVARLSEVFVVLQTKDPCGEVAGVDFGCDGAARERGRATARSASCWLLRVVKDFGDEAPVVVDVAADAVCSPPNLQTISSNFSVVLRALVDGRLREMRLMQPKGVGGVGFVVVIIVVLFVIVAAVVIFVALRKRRSFLIGGVPAFGRSPRRGARTLSRFSSARFLRRSRFENPDYFAPTPADAAASREIRRGDIEFLQKLGEGNFGRVYRAVWRGKRMDEVVVAVKSLRPGCMTPETFLSEADVMRGLVHENVVRLIGVVSAEEPYLIITEYMDGGDLLTYLSDKNLAGGSLSRADADSFCLQICEGMRYLESQHFVHRDLAARNILIDSRLLVKVADFGLTKSLADDQDYYTSKPGAKFPVKWSAPEAVLLNKFSSKSDVWSFGVTMTEIHTMGAVPYPGSTNIEVIEMLQQRRIMMKPLRIPPDVWEVIRLCWNYSPEARPSFERLSLILGEKEEKAGF